MWPGLSQLSHCRERIHAAHRDVGEKQQRWWCGRRGRSRVAREGERRNNSQRRLTGTNPSVGFWTGEKLPNWVLLQTTYRYRRRALMKPLPPRPHTHGRQRTGFPRALARARVSAEGSGDGDGPRTWKHGWMDGWPGDRRPAGQRRRSSSLPASLSDFSLFSGKNLPPCSVVGDRFLPQQSVAASC